ncbi:2-octaprenyl-3-methyl-6-methoxy-1,4-benzoquinol hydroxylase [Rahnella aquatilis CIP 78.65 = ATCC 33071]|uniref:Ubiquinone biosynthesis hydroxylase, UbiH/UbiF/VisC/COQ6 family n=1 Tax=Rahnella aquatilis (strain ATCC 33071 / DSM 4594 / JCM 1683 / NBRC 105701 / NCIMB 13365 / CIP 78.65) TaxID=745277 RepID=H2IX98_RAHAC|nr:3-demethoxyubiquinol 3-hydroxylase [Rahnella aquatilis]AEX53034.1 Ubiquinone biosynthesis hydroxylase, UbiH/UbiF/VisC/COQ6 family [Rahnella aquatilis CIP 78.65 = ATCC 33071]KFD04682.1 2-octaprenyl-3-methyl-6-methoxy-1,4-benzoquinol hydroxylase [Rahnella aquatilis CIP 78.65 = ATCC 33071]
MNNSEKTFDAVIVGGGMVGAAAALGLAQQGLQVALIENDEPVGFDPSAPADLRISAIGCASVRFLQKLGAWDAVEEMRSVPYRRLETWEVSGSEVKFDAQSLGLPELGFMVENRVLQLALWQQFDARTNLTRFCPAKLRHLLQHDDKTWSLQLTTGELLRTKLVVAADGANSLVRQLAGIGVDGWEYRQHCMLINVETAMADQDVTWQQFFPSGPRAFLPLFGNQASLVWYDSPQRIRHLKTLNMQQLTTQVMQAFPARLGTVKAISAGAFPLVRRHAQRYVLPGLALVGDAAHTINPLAGQGVNLGYRDVEALLSVLEKARDHDEAWSSEKVLRRYQRQRRLDNLLMQSGMDLFYTAFSNDLAPVKALRNLALMTAQRAGALKIKALKYALGI